MNEANAYQSGIAYEYDKIISDLCGGDLTLYQDIIKKLLNLVSFDGNDLVLELACGTGIASELLLEKPCPEIYCIDNSWSMLTMAELRLSSDEPRWKFMEKRWIKDNKSADKELRWKGLYEPLQEIPHIKLICQDITLINQPSPLHLGENKVNKIVMANALLSISNIDKLFQAIYNRLEPSGVFLFNVKLRRENSLKTPNNKLLREIINQTITETIKEKTESIGGYEDNTDLPSFYTKEDINNIAKKNSFEIADIVEEPIYLSPPKTLNYLHAAINRYKSFNGDFDNYQFNQKVRDKFQQFISDHSLTNFLLRNEGYFLLKKK